MLSPLEPDLDLAQEAVYTALISEAAGTGTLKEVAEALDISPPATRHLPRGPTNAVKFRPYLPLIAVTEMRRGEARH